MSWVSVPWGIAPNALMVHPARMTKVTRGIEVCNSRMKNMDLATEIDTIFNIIRNWAVGVSNGIKKGIEFMWEVGFIDVLRQFVEVSWILSFWKSGSQSVYIDTGLECAKIPGAVTSMIDERDCGPSSGPASPRRSSTLFFSWVASSSTSDLPSPSPAAISSSLSWLSSHWFEAKWPAVLPRSNLSRKNRHHKAASFSNR